MIVDSPSTTAPRKISARWIEIAGSFLKLGCISFGGPVAHLAYFRAEFVEKRRWLSDSEYGDLVALCQFLPGPASSQTVFGLGLRRGGLVGAFLASVCFTAPSAFLMILFAYGVTQIGDLRSAGWLHGLKLAAVAIVAQAVWGMGRKLCPDRARFTLAIGAAGLALLVSSPLIQVGLIAGGAVLGWLLYKNEVFPPASAGQNGRLASHHFWAAGTLASFGLLLFVLPILARTTGNRDIQVFDSFYRSGSLVFGGGHVILPLLRAEVVPPHWMSDDSFLAGYGAAQAVPGPLFTFAAYLGTVIYNGPHAWLGGLWCLLGLYLPAWMLIGGALPFWHLLRSKPWAQAGLRGANAAVVGVLLAALYNPVWKEGITSARDVTLVFAIYALLEAWRVPAWVVVVVAAAAGQWLL